MKTAVTTRYKDVYESESAEIRRRFEGDTSNGAGRQACAARSALVDRIVAGLFQDHAGEAVGFCLIALGGYGRGLLFPFSDIDLLFLSADEAAEARHKDVLTQVTQSLWDLNLKLGQTSRTPSECGRLHRDNLEFNVGLLDARYLAGEERLFTDLKRRVIPASLRSNGAGLATNLATMTRKRHARGGNTIFHLEPNLKEACGGLRDYNVAHWLAQISGQPPTAQEENAGPAMEKAFDFLASARCLLHYRRGRDDNRLTYEIQMEAAAALGNITPEDYMRRYFRHARAIYRHTTSLLDRSVEQVRGRGSLLGMYQDWRSRLSTADFAVVKDRIYVRQPGALEDPAVLLGLFEQVARHGLALSGESEVAVERALEDLRPRDSENALLFSGLWRRLRPILTLPHAAQALRAMHSSHLLTALFPEFAAVDCLVVRDYYHRYTVDEHTFQTIAGLVGLPAAEGQWEKLFAEIFSELEQPELLSLALLLHDIGKGMTDDHVQGSLQAAEGVFARLSLDQADRSVVRFLIKQHLAMSALTQRRDIFDPETARTLAELAGNPERLKMLTLLTYADIRAVNPEALTPWKAEMLWRLYTAASGYLNRSVDDDRIPVPAQAPADATTFFAGFPRRYQAVHSSEEIAMHLEMAADLAKHPEQVRVGQRGHGWELTVVTADKPRLFASVTGVLASWGMSIQKADAFANAAGIVLDVFRFADLYRTLELNPGEADRLRRDVIHVLQGKQDLATLMSGRQRPAAAAPKVKVNTQIRFDQQSSSHSTLLEIVTGDRPGLLYEISSAIADAGCNIEVALIDTEGQKAIDVFYLTQRGAKIDSTVERALREKLQN